jgi:hypothetical protein
MHLNTTVPDIGVVKDIKICFQKADLITKVTCIGHVSFRKGKYPIPKGIVEKNAHESMNSVYSLLFPAQEQERATSLPNEQPKIDDQAATRSIKELLETLVKNIPPEYAFCIIIVLFMILCLNTMVLWNVLYALEKQHQQILILSKK